MSLYTKLRIAYLYNQIKDQDDTSLRSLIEANLSSESDYRLYSFKEIYAQFLQIIKESSSEYEIDDKIYSWTSKLPDSDELTRRILEYKEHLKKNWTDYSESAFCYYIKGFNEKIQSLSDICCEYFNIRINFCCRGFVGVWLLTFTYINNYICSQHINAITKNHLYCMKKSFYQTPETTEFYLSAESSTCIAASIEATIEGFNDEAGDITFPDY